MPTRNTLIYRWTEKDGTRVYWNPYYCRIEYHKPQNNDFNGGVDMNPKKIHEYTEEQESLMKDILDNGFCLSSDVFEEPTYVEIVTYEYNNEIYYFRIVAGKVVLFRKLSR